VDRAVQAGEGDTVLVLREGTGIRQLFGVPLTSKLPIRSCIVGVVDGLDCPVAG
jgi:microcompartment protein CcmK/EutM